MCFPGADGEVNNSLFPTQYSSMYFHQCILSEILDGVLLSNVWTSPLDPVCVGY